jgi:hypothetical protein
MAAGAVGGFVSGAIMTGTLKGAVRGAIFGGISAGISRGISLQGFDPVVADVLHGVAQGTLSEAFGGDFKSGFIGAFVGHSVGAKLKQLMPDTIAGRTIAAAVAGGAASALGGGKFANGAVSAAFAHLFNNELSGRNRRAAQLRERRVNRHYGRNQYQDTAGIHNVDEASSAGWVQAPSSQSIYHQHGEGNESNVKYWSPDGHSELVFDSNGNVVTSDENLGTYNYGEDPLSWGHFSRDVIPYWELGNTPNDSTPFWDRVCGPGGCFK